VARFDGVFVTGGDEVGFVQAELYGREVCDHYAGATFGEHGGKAARAGPDLQDALFRLQIAAQKAEMDLEGHPTGDIPGEPVVLTFTENVVVATDGID
jgi:hypothetical protein